MKNIQLRLGMINNLMIQILALINEKRFPFRLLLLYLGIIYR